MPSTYILLNSKPDSEVDIIQGIKDTLKGGKFRYEIQGVYGVYDIIVKIDSEKMEDIREAHSKIRKNDKIISTITMLVNEEQET